MRAVMELILGWPMFLPPPNPPQTWGGTELGEVRRGWQQ